MKGVALNEEAVQFLRDFVAAFPELDDEDEPLNGSDAVDRICNLVDRAKWILVKNGEMKS